MLSYVTWCWVRGKMRTENYPLLLATWGSSVTVSMAASLEPWGQEQMVVG